MVGRMTQASVEDFLTDSLMLSTPMIANDPAYLQIKDSIPSIIDMTLMSFGAEDLDELSVKQTYILSLKCLHTIYLRLATASAPEFDVNAEHVGFKKGDRFFHYSALAEKVLEQIGQAEQGVLEVAQVRLSSRNGTLRNYNLSQNQRVNLQASSSSTSIELSWNTFNLSLGDFKNYTLKYSTSPIYDEYSIPAVREGEDIKSLDFYDIKRTKYRITGLNPNSTYYILLMFKGRDGNISYQQVTSFTGGAYTC